MRMHLSSNKAWIAELVVVGLWVSPENQGRYARVKDEKFLVFVLAIAVVLIFGNWAMHHMHVVTDLFRRR